MSVNRDPLRHLDETERDCVARFVELLAARLGANLVEVRLFGSAARGDMWRILPIHSDIDLLVLTHEPLSPELQEELINETYPLYLECGRQIGPQWRTSDGWESPSSDLERAFRANVDKDGRTLFARQPRRTD